MKSVAIILPPMIGDSLMTIPLITELENNNIILSIYTNEYCYNVISYFLKSKNIFKTKNKTKNNFDFIFDFLSNKESKELLKTIKSHCIIGFPDGQFDYHLHLDLPREFSDKPAPEIFLQALKYLNILTPKEYSFKRTINWKYTNQRKIVLAPSAGNINRCYPLNDFIELAEKLSSAGQVVEFLLGPSDLHLKEKLKLQKIRISSNIKNTLDYLQTAKLIVASEGGLMHISGCFGIPLLGLFKVSKIINWFPYSLAFQKALGHETNDYVNIAKLNMDIISALHTIDVIDSQIYPIRKICRKNE